MNAFVLGFGLAGAWFASMAIINGSRGRKGPALLGMVIAVAWAIGAYNVWG